MKRLLLSIAAMTAMTTLSAQRMLVLYYSETGTTKTVAQELQKQTGADIESIECVEPYSGNFQETVHNPIVTLLKEQDFAGKKIVPFCTFGSGGLNTSSDALRKALPKAQVLEGYGVRTARVAAASKELDRFLKENGYKKGRVEKLPDYSAQQPVTNQEKAIFDAACSSYQFPLGTPQTVGKRTTPDGTDYKYTVKGRGMNGQESTSVIYVTVGKAADAKPEFTQVVR